MEIVVLVYFLQTFQKDLISSIINNILIYELSSLQIDQTLMYGLELS